MKISAVQSGLFKDVRACMDAGSWPGMSPAQVSGHVQNHVSKDSGIREGSPEIYREESSSSKTVYEIRLVPRH